MKVTISQATVGAGRHIRTRVNVRVPFDPNASNKNAAVKETLATALSHALDRFRSRGSDIDIVFWTFYGFRWDGAQWVPSPPAPPEYSMSGRPLEVALREAQSRARDDNMVTPDADTDELPLPRGSSGGAFIPTVLAWSFHSREGLTLKERKISQSEHVRRALRADINVSAAELQARYGLKRATILSLRREVISELAPAARKVLMIDPVKPRPAALPIDKASKSEAIRRVMLGQLSRDGKIDLDSIVETYGIPRPMARRLKQEALRRK